MASKIKNIELIQNLFGDETKFILDKFEKEKINISQRSSNFTLKMANLICNYVDFIYYGDFSVLNNKSIFEIENEYNDWYKLSKSKYSSLNYVENGLILYDYRKNGKGFYWIDLQTHYSSEMMFNMNNCGRVGATRTLIILVENKENGENLMHVLIVIDKDHNIIQIKGVENTKPINFYDYILDFFIKHNPIIGFKGVFNTSLDFSLLDFNDEDKHKIKLVKPHLFNLI